MNTAQPFVFIRLLITLCLLFGTGTGQIASAADEAIANPDTGKLFAHVWRLRGEVSASGTEGLARPLHEGSPVYVGELIRATSTGEAVLKTADAGIVAVRPGSEFIAERFAAEGKTTDRQIVRLITGSLRIISGWIARLNHPEHRIITPSATIGIRGTDHEPYVLAANMANNVNRPGTYDKVNRGATSLEANGGSVLIDQGRVGFARDPNSTPPATRALMTLLLPTLLARVPDFYVPGAFDAELDRYSATADTQSRQQLENLQSGVPDAAPEPAATPPQPATTQAPAIVPAGCVPEAIAADWLNRLDTAIPGRDIKTVLGLFAADATARASVRNADNKLTVIELNRDEIVQSTLSAMIGLKDYRQRRIAVEARLIEGENAGDCRRIETRSVVIEQGLMNDKPYRFEASETYWLELLDGEWQATRAETVQR